MTEGQVINVDCRDGVLTIPGPIDCIITDPPYGIAYKSNFATKARSRERFNRDIEADGDPVGAIDLFSDVMELLFPKLANDADVYIFTAWSVFSIWEEMLAERFPEMPLKMMLIWEKGWPGLGDLDTNWGCGYEVILYCKKGSRPVNHRRRAVMHFPRIGAGQNIHPTEKPVALLEELIGVSTNPGDLVVDPFAGSGSTIWAAQRLGREGIGFEKDEEYARSANERLTRLGFDLFS